MTRRMLLGIKERAERSTWPLAPWERWTGHRRRGRRRYPPCHRPHLGLIAYHARRIVLDQPETLGDGDCEAVRPGRLGQPVNTVTSLAYVLAGAWLLRRVPALPAEDRAGATAYAALAALNGVGSVAYRGQEEQMAEAVRSLGTGGT